jgi:formylmethanofuran dehydrogenase subunit E
MTTTFVPPAWAFEFHGHQCPFMPLGYRMGRLAMEKLGVEREPDHGFFVFPELGEGHPQTCLMDGLQVATGATYGKVMMAKTFYGKLAATFYKPGKGAVRYALKPDFVDAMGRFPFFAFRKQGMEPSQIPVEARDEILNWVYEQADDFIFAFEARPASSSPRSRAPSTRSNAVPVASMFSSAMSGRRTDSRFAFLAPAIERIIKVPYQHQGD